MLTCPYCSITLESVPKRKKKCPSCGKFIFVRGGKPVTEDEARIQDNLWHLQWFRLTRLDFDKCRAELSGEFGVIASVNDTVWRLLNTQVAMSNRADVLEQAYKEMARIATEEGKDPQPYLDEANRMTKVRINQGTHEAFTHEMAEMQSRSNDAYYMKYVKGIGIRTCNDDHVCPACREIASRIWPIDQVPELPYEKCTSKTGCRCGISTIIDLNAPTTQQDEHSIEQSRAKLEELRARAATLRQ